MILRIRQTCALLRRQLADLLTGPLALALLPALLLAGYWAGGESALLWSTVAFPALLVVAGVFGRTPAPAGMETGPPAPGASLEEAIDAALLRARDQGGMTACMMLELENHAALRNTHGDAATGQAADRVADRLNACLRRRDRVFRFDDAIFGIVLSPPRSMTPEAVCKLAARLQGEAQRPAPAAPEGPRFTAAIGICLSAGGLAENGSGLAAVATAALREAATHGPSAIRVRRPEPGIPAPGIRPARPQDEIAQALNGGEIIAWYQPQLCTDTGRVSGFEALARWRHPQRGVLLPGAFLPHVEKAGLTGTLQAIMLREALEAVGRWDGAGFTIPGVGVNFSPTDLRDPALPDTIAWELDRNDLAPSRLKIEILETVVSTSPDDDTARNIRRLSDLGCRIDLDDFGTGHASISSLKRFSIDRLKIDRSFVRGIDTDPRQQRMVAAILTMAEQLELETLAEGVETAGEHSLLAQLGCGHVQGFGIARPMPPEATLPWLRTHSGKLQAPPDLRKGAV
ncbi:bifunctional diguanylate cyclase/phosphodiesterase [Roseovarius sp.]|uniref:bifunctional diguanylate cyclase/phosphodiesterase n=1 Tax=Roseovarius sp. TaxID=1486281 RepID=UPI00260E55CB|nr:bifunctional diguanylate cyclase/phosphodiesterase [Roseovarius sp.]MDM8167258.1 bifunctional diguanylate cyclase/phosphodiesterase [Roseovarius sp.]